MKNLLFYLELLVLYIFTFVIFRKIYPQGIVFYQGLIIIILIFMAAEFFVFFTSASNKKVEKYLVGFIFLFSAYSFHITLPSLVDRSFSIYMIGLLKNSPILTIPQIKEATYSGFFGENNAIARRVDEHIASGNIICNSGGC